MTIAGYTSILTVIALFSGAAVSIGHSQYASENKQIIIELSRYQAATQVFREKLDALPGDFKSAQAFGLGQNGDGDGKIGVSERPETHQEVMQFWTHLAKMGLIKGSYSGQSGPGESGYHAIIDENAPASAYPNAGWSIHPDIGEAKDNSSRFDGYYGSYLFFGRETNRAVTYGDILSANAMAQLDQKIDDGMPATGFFVAARPSLSPNCAVGNDASATYRKSDAPDACHIVIKDVAGF